MKIFSLSLLLVLASCAKTDANDVQEEINKINESAPILVDDETRFDKASVEGKEIEFQYTMLSMEYSEYDFKKMNSEFVPSQINTICNIYLHQGYYEKGYSITYKYLDKNAKHVLSIQTNESVCKFL